MVADPFDRWWSRFEQRTADEPAHETALRLGRKVRRTRVAERGSFLTRLWLVLLQRRYDYGVALFLLNDLTDRRHLADLARRLTPLPGLLSMEQESHLAELMRILAAAGELRPVEAYLLRRPIGPCWPTVPWALWPGHGPLFVQAWRRFLDEQDPRRWAGGSVARPFLADAQAIRAVRETLEDETWQPLRQALVQQAHASAWLSDDRRAAFERAIA